MAGTGRLSQLIGDALSRSRFPDVPLKVALSGGADSAGLARLALEVDAEASAIHVNHSLAASPQMETAAHRVADQLEMSLEVTVVEVPQDGSPEAAARDVRYQVFDDTGPVVLTAHTAEDNAETILINLMRGTGLPGLTGISYHRPPNVWRPLLSVGRSELRELATLAGLEFVDDPSNTDLTLTRNRIRSQLLPVLSEFNPQIVDTLNEMGSHLSADDQFLESLVNSGSPSGDLATAVLITSPAAIADRMIMAWLRGSELVPTTAMVARVWSVVRGESSAQQLQHGAVVRRRGAVVEIEEVS